MRVGRMAGSPERQCWTSRSGDGYRPSSRRSWDRLPAGRGFGPGERELDLEDLLSDLGNIGRCAGSARSDQPAHARVADAGLAVLAVARIPVLKLSVALDGDVQVVPAHCALERELQRLGTAGRERQRGAPRRVPVRHGRFGRRRAAVLEADRDLVVVPWAVQGLDGEAGPWSARAALEAAEEPVGPVD